MAATGAAFGQGTGTVLLNALQCYGNETNLTQCTGADFGTAPCPHSRDAGVTCQLRQCKLAISVRSKWHYTNIDHTIAYPSNVQVVTASSTSINVAWSAPVEFVSSIVKYR